MNSPESLREFTNELVRRGLPIEYSHRATEEFADHHRDLSEELQLAGMDETTAVAAATERLGDAKALIKKTVREYQHRHWCGRWPVVAFLVGPVALSITVWMGTMFSLAIVDNVGEAVGFGIPESSRDLSLLGLMILYAVVYWLLLIVPAVLVFALSRMVFRSGVGRRWIILSSILLAICAGFVRCGFVTSPENLEHPFVVSMPFWLPLQSPGKIADWYFGQPQQMAQAMTPLVIAVIIVWRDFARRRMPPLAA
jgi:hypothetical protein